MAAATQVAAAVDRRRRAAVEHGAHHRDVVLRVVLEIGVLDDQVVAGRAFDAGADGAAFAAVLRHAMQADAGHARHDGRSSDRVEQSSTTMISFSTPSGARSTA